MGGEAYNWVPDCIKDRHQAVRVNILSDLSPVKSGVIIDSYIAPLLFSLYINDIIKVKLKCTKFYHLSL